ncbi:MAG TPA: NADP-dependent oxidoreductase [Pseudomonadales bacterium]|nr:NADP-dependent oxidoreductase [Pseudomonadales bacterium]
MKAVFLNQKGEADSLVVGEIPEPRAQAGEVLVKVHATAVMPTELQWFPTFNLPSGKPRPFPVVLSHEFSGVVASTGPKVTGVSVEDEVYGLNDWFTNGAQAEYCLVQETALARKPKSLRHSEAAVVPVSALTAWQGLFERIKLERGQRVLIHGAAGAVGSFAVQMARWWGAQVIAPVSSGNMDFVRSLGANEVMDYRTTRFEDTVKEVDAIFDAVGGEVMERSWNILSKGGKAVTVATQSSEAADQRVRDAFMLVRADGALLATIAGLIDAGEFRVFVAEVLPLAEARQAYAMAQQGSARGKVVLSLQDDAPLNS